MLETTADLTDTIRSFTTESQGDYVSMLEHFKDVAADYGIDIDSLLVGRELHEDDVGVTRHRIATERSEAKEVHLGVSVPIKVSPSAKFVARFAAYTETNRTQVRNALELEAPSSQTRLGLDICRWHPGANITVQLAVDGANILRPIQSFIWNGAWKILRFDVELLDNSVANTVILRFDIAVEGLPITALRPEIQIEKNPKDVNATSQSTFIEQSTPTTAFASYAVLDRQEVLARVRSLQIFTGIDVFLDCLSLQPGEQWKPKIHNEILNRDTFWLFWSRNAIQSRWVDWEWREALASKSLAGIQPHPLEPQELAPPPEELSELQFGAVYEWYILLLRESKAPSPRN